MGAITLGDPWATQGRVWVKSARTCFGDFTTWYVGTVPFLESYTVSSGCQSLGFWLFGGLKVRMHAANVGAKKNGKKTRFSGPGVRARPCP